MKIIKYTPWCAVFAALLAATSVVHAEETSTPPEETPTPAYTLSANVGLFSQYVFRGISYTQGKPAVQGGLDFSHQSGLYLGTWGTSVSDAALNNAAGEIDVYGGYTNTVGDFTYDLSLLLFTFPNGQINGTGEKYTTLELGAALTWKFLNVKYSHTVTDYFGFNDKSMGMGRGNSHGSYYIEGNLSHEFLPSWKGLIHVGRQHIQHYGEYDYTDWKFGVTKDFEGGWQAGVAWITTNADTPLYTVCDGSNRCKDTGANKWLVHVMRTF
ncbi:MAG: TorF family putative porin [Proteobacteria bacterium]|nr:TorF family putative porin [Pseudomonadota bacterium]